MVTGMVVGGVRLPSPVRRQGQSGCAPGRERERQMKVTLNVDGSVSFEVETAADAIALATALKGTANGALGGEWPPARPATKPKTVTEAVMGVDVPLDFDVDEVEAAEAADDLKTHFSRPKKARKARTYDASPERIKAAKEMGLSVGHYQVWEFLVDNDSRTRGIGPEDVARRFKITRSSANQRLIILVRKGYAERISFGRYKAACK